MAVCCQGQGGEEWIIIVRYGRRLERSWEYSFYFECDLKLLGKWFSESPVPLVGYKSGTNVEETTEHAHTIEVLVLPVLCI